MSSYNELIKNFERVRSYMREFYVYGFKSRADYDKKSARSYDDEKRRMESILGDYMSDFNKSYKENVRMVSKKLRFGESYDIILKKEFE